MIRLTQGIILLMFCEFILCFSDINVRLQSLFAQAQNFDHNAQRKCFGFSKLFDLNHLKSRYSLGQKFKDS